MKNILITIGVILVAVVGWQFWLSKIPQTLGADTGGKVTGTVETAGSWATFTTTRVNTSDDSRAVCNGTCSFADPGAQTSDYSFGISAGASIDGILVAVEGSTAFSTCNLDVSLSWNDGTSFTTAKRQSMTTTEGTKNYGGATDTWGRTWSSSEFDNGAFRARFDGQTCSFDNRIDYIAITVYYTESGGGGSSVVNARPIPIILD